MVELEDIDTLLECSKCHKLFEVKELYKVERLTFPWSREKKYSLVCKKCAGK